MMNQAPARRPSVVATVINWTITLFVVFFLFVLLFLMWPMIQARLGQSGVDLPNLPMLPTAAIAPASKTSPQTSPAPFSAPIGVPAAPLPGIAQNAATAQAMYQATAQAAEPPPNTNVTGDSTPLLIEEKPVVRQGAGENVPTAEPIALAQSDDQIGSKALPVNVQETHTCKHGQVWTERGCKNP